MAPVTPAKSYHFADFIRFVAMCAIIFQHSFIVNKVLLLQDYPSVLMFFFLKVVAKIGSISFFIVSGFLLSAALDHYTSGEYLNRRVKNIFKPYVLFVLIYLMLDFAGAFFGSQVITSPEEIPSFIIGKISGVFLFTSYWFIFNYFISVMILLALRKYLYTPWLGAVLLCCTLLYCINIHVEWFDTRHTTAFAGFVFFLWLGANLKKHEEKFWRAVDATPYWKIIPVVLVTLGLNFCETFFLIEKGASVVDSSLKITNILYALAVFLLLSRAGRNIHFRFLNPRDETYPLYLIHPIFLKVINYALLPMLPAIARAVTVEQPGWLAILLYQVGWFAVIYTLSLLAVKMILHSPFRWIFGKQGKDVLSPLQSFRVLMNGVRNFKF